MFGVSHWAKDKPRKIIQQKPNVFEIFGDSNVIKYEIIYGCFLFWEPVKVYLYFGHYVD